VPGPQFPIYLLGRELHELVPVAFLPDNYALTIAAMSYNGKLDFSLLGDYDAMPDIDLVGEYVGEALEELLVAAGRPPNNRGRTSRRRSSARESTVG
jgi:diacylglycerol O-acyltransferase